MKTTLKLKPVKLDGDYRKKWNIHLTDFCNLYKNGKKVSDALYRIGGFGGDIKENYFMLLKNIEAHYPDNITKEKHRKPHLENRWCILNKKGVEKVNFKPFESPYLHGGQVYSLDGKYYDIESGKLYCHSCSSSIISKRYIFLENKYDKDESKRGVMRIKKSNGACKIFK